MRAERVWRDEEFVAPGAMPDPRILAGLLLGAFALGLASALRGRVAVGRTAVGWAGALLTLGGGALGLLLLYSGTTPHAWFQGNANRVLLSPLDLLACPLLLLAARHRLSPWGWQVLLALLGAALALGAAHWLIADLTGRCPQVHGAVLRWVAALRLLLLLAVIALRPRAPGPAPG